MRSVVATTRANRLSAMLLCALTIVCACGADGSNDGKSSSLTGRTFLSQAVTVRGEPRPLVDDTQIRLTFWPDHRLTATAGCNMLTGTVRIDESRLDVSGLGSTEMGCDAPRHEQDEWLASVLSASPAYVIADGRLRLQAADTVIEFLDREVADPDRPLQHTTWAVDGFIDGTVASSVPAGASATIVFLDDTVVVTVPSCNEGRAAVKISTTAIEVGRLVVTDLACTGPSQQVEAAIVAVLTGTIAYDIQGPMLRLTRGNGNGLTLRAQ